MIKSSPTFQYWDTILNIEVLVLTIVRAHHEKNSPLYVEALEAIVGYFFAFDRYHYARWVPVHICYGRNTCDHNLLRIRCTGRLKLTSNLNPKLLRKGMLPPETTKPC